MVFENQCGSHVAMTQKRKKLEPEEQTGEANATVWAPKVVAESKIKMRSP